MVEVDYFVPLFLPFYSISSTDRYIPAACFSIVHGLPSLHYLYGVLYFLTTLIRIFHILLVLSSLTVPAPSSSAPAMKGTCGPDIGAYLPYRSSNIPVVVVGVEAAINTTARPLQYGFRFYGHLSTGHESGDEPYRQPGHLGS